MKKFCAYVDLLGFKETLRHWDRSVKYYKVMERLMTDVAELMRKLALTDDDPLVKHSDLRYFIFSDTLVMTAKRAFPIILACSLLQTRGMGLGFLFRGGISFGNHLETIGKRKILVVSRSLTDAYQCEREIAHNPRVVLDPRQLDRFREGGALSSFSRLLFQSRDNVWFVNPFFWARLFGERVIPDQHSVGVRVGIIRGLRRYKTKKNVLAKYLWTASLYNSWCRFNFIPGDLGYGLRRIRLPTQKQDAEVYYYDKPGGERMLYLHRTFAANLALAKKRWSREPNGRRRHWEWFVRRRGGKEPGIC